MQRWLATSEGAGVWSSLPLDFSKEPNEQMAIPPAKPQSFEMDPLYEGAYKP